jgi:hypothetical protein
MHNKLGRICKEVVSASFKDLPGGTEKTTKNSVSITGVPGDILAIWNLPYTKHE